MLTITDVKTKAPATIEVRLSDGRTIPLDAGEIMDSSEFELLKEPARFANIVVSDWGHGIEWPDIDQGLSIETVLRLAREQAGKAFPTRDFNAWMKRNGLTLSTAAEALGLSRRTIVYYHTGQKPIPVYIGLACEGWEARKRRDAA